MSKTVYISIGNSDDKLPQAEWARFHRDVDFAIRWGEPNIWGAWVSETTAQWQNACWCVDLEPRHIERLRRVLPLIAPGACGTGPVPHHCPSSPPQAPPSRTAANSLSRSSASRSPR